MILIVISVILIGVSALPYLSINQNPQVEFPILDITLTYPNASKQLIQNQVLTPLIPLLKQNKNILKSHFVIQDGQMIGDLKLQFDANMADQYWDIRGKLDTIQQSLPPEANLDLQKRKISHFVVPFVVAVITSTNTTEDVQRRKEIAHHIKAKLSSIPDISEITLLESTQELTVMLDPGVLAHHMVSLQDIQKALRNGVQIQPKGTLPFDGQSIPVEVPEQYQRLADIQNTPIFNAAGERHTLGNLAQISVTPESNRHSRFNGQPCLFIEIKLAHDTNVFTVQRQIDKVLQDFQNTPKATIHGVYNESFIVKNRLEDLAFSLLSGIVLLGITLLFTVGYRSTVVISLLLPLSIFFSLALLVVCGIGIQQVVIAGFIISLGLVVDPGIVLAEEAKLIQEHHGKSIKEAAIQAAITMAPSLISSSLTTILGFAPIFFMHSEEGLYLQSLAVSVWLSIVASLLVSLMVITLILARIGTSASVTKLPKIPSLLDMLTPFRDHQYVRYMQLSMRHPWIILGLSLGVFLVIFGMNRALPTTLFPPVDDPYFYINIQGPPGTSLEKTNHITDTIERSLRHNPLISDISSSIGHPFPLVNISMHTVHQNPQSAQLFVQLKEVNLPQKEQLMREIEAQFGNRYRDTQISAYTFAYMKERYPAQITLFIHDTTHAGALGAAQKIEQSLAQFPWIQTIHNRPSNLQPTLAFARDSTRIQASQVSEKEVSDALTATTAGLSVVHFQDEKGETFPITLRFPQNKEDPMASFDTVLLRSQTDRFFPLSAFMSLSFRSNTPAMMYEEFTPTTYLGVTLTPEQDPKAAKKIISEHLNTLDLGERTWITYQGMVEKEAEIFYGFSQYAGFFLILMFAIFVIQFNSFSAPFLIFLSTPYSIAGSILLLNVTHQPFTFLTYVGLIGLIGIAVNDAILFVAEANIVREQENGTVKEAVIESGKRRFRPMILTSLTTFIGLTPLAVSNTMFKPLAIVIMGGLISSTLFALFVLPSFYCGLGRLLRWDHHR